MRLTTSFGLMTTANLLGLAISPVIAGLIGGTGLRIVFVADVVLLVMLGALVARRMTSDGLPRGSAAFVPAP